MNKVRILVIEDEVLIADDIEKLLYGLGYAPVLFLENTDDLSTSVDFDHIDLVIVGIGLKGKKDGIMLVHEIKKTKDIPVIFLTTYSDPATVERAVAARPAAYLLKPFDERQLAVSIVLAIRNHTEKAMTDRPELPTPEAESPFYCLNNCIFLKKKTSFERINYSDILWAEADSNYTEVKTTNDRFILAITLKKLHDKLVSPLFMRIHRSYIVNLDHIEAIDGNMISIQNCKIPVSSHCRDDLFSRFNIL